MSTHYDDIAFEYEIINSQLPVKKYAEEFTFLNLLGDGLVVVNRKKTTIFDRSTIYRSFLQN